LAILHPREGVCGGAKFLAPHYFRQRAVFAFVEFCVCDSNSLYQSYADQAQSPRLSRRDPLGITAGELFCVLNTIPAAHQHGMGVANTNS